MVAYAVDVLSIEDLECSHYDKSLAGHSRYIACCVSRSRCYKSNVLTINTWWFL